MRDNSLKIVEGINKVLSEYDMPLTIRQIYYQLVSRHIIENSLKSYKNFDRIAVKGRREGLIDASKIEDRSKPLIKQASWDGLHDFMETVSISYKKNVWNEQAEYVEVWVEKDALSGVLEPIINKYDCHLAVGRGYQSLSNKCRAKARFEGKQATILYLGDFDPTGLDISRDLTQEFEGIATIERIALNEAQIKEHNLPPIPTKPTDSRTAKHIEQYGDVAVELDALPPDVLKELCATAILNHLDLKAFQETKEAEKRDLSQINEWLEGLQ